MKTYEVTAKPEFLPAWESAPRFTVTAASKKDAIAKARREAANVGTFQRGDGRVSFKAEEVR